MSENGEGTVLERVFEKHKRNCPWNSGKRCKVEGYRWCAMDTCGVFFWATTLVESGYINGDIRGVS